MSARHKPSRVSNMRASKKARCKRQYDAAGSDREFGENVREEGNWQPARRSACARWGFLLPYCGSYPVHRGGIGFREEHTRPLPCGTGNPHVGKHLVGRGGYCQTPGTGAARDAPENPAYFSGSREFLESEMDCSRNPGGTVFIETRCAPRGNRAPGSVLIGAGGSFTGHGRKISCRAKRRTAPTRGDCARVSSCPESVNSGRSAVGARLLRPGTDHKFAAGIAKLIRDDVCLHFA